MRRLSTLLLKIKLWLMIRFDKMYYDFIKRDPILNQTYYKNDKNKIIKSIWTRSMQHDFDTYLLSYNDVIKRVETYKIGTLFKHALREQFDLTVEVIPNYERE